MSGSTQELNYDRFRCLLLNGTIEASTDDQSGVVQIKNKFPYVGTGTLLVRQNMALSFLFLGNNIQSVVEHLKINAVPYNIEECIKRVILIYGNISRKLCGLTVSTPVKAESTFKSSRINRLKDPQKSYAAIFEENELCMTDVS